MVSLDVYFDIIMPLKFLISYNNDIMSVEGSSIVRFIECVGGMFLQEKYKKVAQFNEF